MRSVLIWVLATLLPLICLGQEDAEDSKLTVQEIQCKGNESTACSFISNHVHLSAGDAVDEDEIQNAKLRLSSLPNFKSVDIRLEKGAERGRVVVVVEVAEASAIVKEFAFGIISEEFLYQQLGLRVSHQNLFGTGKILSLQGIGRLGPDNLKKESGLRLQYADPNLVGSSKYFFIAGMTYDKGEYAVSYSNANGLWGRYKYEKSGFDLSLGRRFGEFSYLTLTYSEYPQSDMFFYEEGSATPTYKDPYFRSLKFGYGWNSEDDPYFPTQGSRFSSSLGWSYDGNGASSLVFAGVGFRQTVTTAGGTSWTFKAGGTPRTEFRSTLEDDFGLTAKFARPLPKGFLGGIERGHGYFEFGTRNIGPAYSSYSGTILEPVIRAGVRFETKSLGVVDLYAMGSQKYSIGGGR